MPWMAYDILYFNGIEDGLLFKKLFKDLRHVPGIGIELWFAVRWYVIGRILMSLRQFFSRTRKKLATKG